MTHQLDQYKDVAEKSVERILKDTGGDSVAIIVVKDGASIICSRVTKVQSA